ncbi:DNA-directed RNA polymerase II subunit RPB1-like isoform X2 [Entelurus aequoreus]|uniref:DNA-directed RNA polymerase II subunit RPB1-like isoform X2 n=1 Tax=Entelurus aequoreus TaxID=161455 RepID=UPI002B1CE547|nr:DNA-directed RNA polymerase II subunit RPB1-like isoform X2 [Entelurus aequoreus]
MSPKAKKTSVALCWATALLLTCTLKVDSYRLRKADHRKDAPEVKAAGLRRGRIVFGKNPQAMDAKTSNASDNNYQADVPAPVQQEASSWSSLYCAAEQMKLRVQAPGLQHISVQQANGRPLPLSLVPPTCGYNMLWNSGGFLMLVPYGGCHMLQQGGSFVLPMLWQELPVSLWCPKPPRTTAAPSDLQVQVPPFLLHNPEMRTWPQARVAPAVPQSRKSPSESQVQTLPSGPQYSKLPSEPQVQMIQPGSDFPVAAVLQDPKLPSDPHVHSLPPGSLLPFPPLPHNYMMHQVPMGPPASQKPYVHQHHTVPQVGQYSLFNPHAWHFVGYQPPPGKHPPTQKDPRNPGMQSHIPYFHWHHPHYPHYPPNDPHYPPNDPHYPPNDPHYPPNDPHYPPNDPHYPPNGPHYPPNGPHYPPNGPHYPPKQTRRPGQTTTAAPFQIPPELIPSYQDFMAMLDAQ